MKLHKHIIIVNGKKHDNCPLYFLSSSLWRFIKNPCKISKKCRYGLTDIKVPPKCPLKKGLKVKIEMKTKYKPINKYW